MNTTKTNTAEAPDESQPASTTAPITAMPTPTPEEVLRGQLAQALEENTALKNARDILTARIGGLTQDRDGLHAKVKELERNPLIFALSNIDAGQVLEDAGADLQKLSAAVRKMDTKGTFVFKLTVKPFKGDALVFVPEIKVSEPKAEAAQSIFYADDAGELSRNDPRQREFGFSRGDRSAPGDREPYSDETAGQ